MSEHDLQLAAALTEKDAEIERLRKHLAALLEHALSLHRAVFQMQDRWDKLSKQARDDVWTKVRARNTELLDAMCVISTDAAWKEKMNTREGVKMEDYLFADVIFPSIRRARL